MKMPKLRYSVMSLFGAVAFVSVACAAMTRPSNLCASVVWTASTVFLAGSVVGRHRRASFVGFAVFGCGHMVLFIGRWLD